ncbi:F-box/WD repeat-containing protein 4 [Takifugu flavidus]|uniref:F-box/WD repeat-containing protein 4 n=1 Tax=Takifugu flavidus TaxID=433684 RepID=UPI00016E6F29|nr:F-box/WD repeat-containing protein 4 [Takifugu flavidus]|eukprot:XP_003963680.1 PREDICTED: F-box/WD repeat-containing protein 4 [Takifugu rubripes]
MLFLQLPDDVLYHILSYLDFKSLGRLSQVCKSTYQFLNRDAVWRNVAKEFLNTGITWSGTDKYGHIPLKNRVRTAQNWYNGICKRATPLKWKTKLLPWLQLDGDTLFLSQAGEIGAYHLRQASSKFSRKPKETYSGHKGDVCRFSLTDSHLISGGSDGKILVYNRGNYKSVELSGHKQEVNCLDTKNGLIISGSRDQTTRIWTLASTYPRETLHMNDRVWSVAINPSLNSFVTGTACCKNISPLQIWDVERLEFVCSLGSQFRRGAGVLDIVFETPFQLLTCGYDTFIRMWDLRLNPRKCVKEWEEPHDCTLYCIQTDGNHMIASGSSYYGVVRFWDKRQSKCLQYFQLCAHPVTSPVYCLQFSSSHLYAALANTLQTLDFSQSLF